MNEGQRSDDSIELCVSGIGPYLLALDCRSVQQVVGEDEAAEVSELAEVDACTLLGARVAMTSRRGVVVAGEHAPYLLRLGPRIDIWTAPVSSLARLPVFVAPRGHVGCFIGVARTADTYALLLEPALL